MVDVVKGNWTNESAFNLPLALAESRQWIEAVVGQKFPSDDFQISLKNGILLCHLINQIKPKSVLKISNGKSDFDQRGNLVEFIKACKQVGLRDAQLFDPNDLFEAQRMRNVAICLYWLGRAARCIPTYKGPHLNLQVFKKMHCTACKKTIEGNNYLATLNQQYHIGCAKCSECNCSLDPKLPFYQNGDRIYCPNCMVSAANTSTDLNGPGAKGKGGKGPHSHGHGDKCGGCFKDMDGKDHVLDKDKKWCLDCICDQCHEPLLGNFSVKNGKKYCDGCRCFDCDVPLTNGFYEEGNLRFCDQCNHKHEEDLKQPTKKPPHTHDHSHEDLKGKPHSHAHDHSNHDLKLGPKGCRTCGKPTTGKPHKGGDRDHYCPPHENEHCCAHCDLELSGPAKDDGKGKKYHPDCYQKVNKGPKDNGCRVCGKSLAGKPHKGGDRDHFCPPHENEHCCAHCDLELSGPVKDDGKGKRYHPDCHKGTKDDGCRVCGKSLAGKPHKGGDRDQFCPPHENEYCCAHCDLELSGPVKDDGKGKRYHPDCYQKSNQNLHGPCAGCNKSIDVKPLEVLDKKWHPDCFKCTGCKATIPGGKFAEGDDGKPYCMNCGDGDTTNLTWGPKDKCGGCEKPLAGMVTHVMNHFWHQGCFKCYRCNVEKFTTGYFPLNEKPYCEACHIILTQPDRCIKCSEVLVGECIKTETGTYHKKCFACTTCNKGLSKEDGQTKFGRPYCKLCAPKASRTCVKCRKVVTTNEEYTEAGGKSYCKSCAPANTQHVYGDDKKSGFTIDPRSGKRTVRTG